MPIRELERLLWGDVLFETFTLKLVSVGTELGVHTQVTV